MDFETESEISSIRSNISSQRNSYKVPNNPLQNKTTTRNNSFQNNDNKTTTRNNPLQNKTIPRNNSLQHDNKTISIPRNNSLQHDSKTTTNSLQHNSKTTTSSLQHDNKTTTNSLQHDIVRSFAVNGKTAQLIKKEFWSQLPENTRIAYSYKTKTSDVFIRSAFVKRQFVQKETMKEFILVACGSNFYPLLRDNIQSIYIYPKEFKKTPQKQSLYKLVSELNEKLNILSKKKV